MIKSYYDLFLKLDILLLVMLKNLKMHPSILLNINKIIITF